MYCTSRLFYVYKNNFAVYFRHTPLNYGSFFSFTTEYGFLFSFGTSSTAPYLFARYITAVHRTTHKTHMANAIADHHSDIFSQKCRTSKTAAGIIPKILINILRIKQRKKPPLRFVLRIYIILSVYPAPVVVQV